MDIKLILLRLKQADYKYSEASKIKDEIKRLPRDEQERIIDGLRYEKTKSDNSNIIDVINDIINDSKPK